MTGLTELDDILANLDPLLDEEEFAFCQLPADLGLEAVSPELFALIREEEGLTAILPRGSAERAGLAYDGAFSKITIGAHSSLHAVGLTARIAGALADAGISANLVAGVHHDHVFIPADRAGEALALLESMS